MQGSLVISIDGCGVAQSLHMDTFDLGFLGKKSVVRQTDIIFNEESQSWELWYLDADGSRAIVPHMSGVPSYEEARALEVGWLNDCRLMGIHPMSPAGLDVAEVIRHVKSTQ